MQRSLVHVRVIYADVDRMNVVHHANYLRYFETARTEFLRRRGASYAQVEASGIIMPIIDVQIRYHAPARYDDLLAIDVHVSEIRPVAVTFGYAVRRVGEETLLVRGSTALASCNAAGRPVRLPTAIRDLLDRPELRESEHAGLG
jgi:acyl-CoA thioester hydrolase